MIISQVVFSRIQSGMVVSHRFGDCFMRVRVLEFVACTRGTRDECHCHAAMWLSFSCCDYFYTSTLGGVVLSGHNLTQGGNDRGYLYSFIRAWHLLRIGYCLTGRRGSFLFLFNSYW